MPNSVAQLTNDELLTLGARLRVLTVRLVADESIAEDLAQDAWLILRRSARADVRTPGS